MKFRPRQFLSFRLVLVALSLFSLAQMVMKELELRNHQFSVSGHPGVFVEPILLSSFLVIASLLLLLKNVPARFVAIFLSGLVFYVTLPRSLWSMAAMAEVPLYSSQHFGIWWKNLDAGELLQIILAALVLSFSAASLASTFIRRRQSESLYP